MTRTDALATAHESLHRRFRSVALLGVAMIAFGVGLGASSLIPVLVTGLMIVVGAVFVSLGGGGMKAAKRNAQALRAGNK